MSDDGTFELGIVMAGAVSGGAYTAGVVDFLIEALDAWHEAKDAGEDVPRHQLRVRVMTGTSAGAMNTALATVAFNEDFEHVHEVPAPPQVSASNKGYRSWVEKIDIKKMLGTSDLDDEKQPLRSILNSKPLDDIADEAINYSWRGRPRPYVVRTLPVYFAVTNLRGVPYSIQFSAGPNHEMSFHGDVMKFALAQPSDRQLDQSDHEARDGAIVLPADQPGDPNWKKLRDAALASGAFPVGLRARPLSRDPTYYDKLKWTAPAEAKPGPGGECQCFEDKEQPPNWSDQKPDGDYHFVNVDGGVINNEPFEIARRVLAGGPDKRNPRDPKNADRAVLMIDPFPNVVDFKKDYDPDKESALLSVLKRLVSVVIQNARFKREELALAGKSGEEIYSRFLIAPASKIGHGDDRKEDRKALLSGSLGAFGGFLSQRFRESDYILGRRNCQQFLRVHFVLHENNKIFNDWNGALKNRLALKRDNGETYLPIIPLLPLPEPGDPYSPDEGLRRKIDLPDRPRLNPAALDAIYSGAKKRVNAIAKRLIADGDFGFGKRLAVQFAWAAFGRGFVMEKIKGWVESSLKEWDVLEKSGIPAPGPATDLEDRGH